MYIEICSSLLYLIAEIFTNGHDIMILDILSLGSIISGISVIICKNPILSILFLIGLFACVATYLIFIGFNFIGLSYLIVYIGAVNKRIIRFFWSNHAAWVKISLYKILLIIKNLIHSFSNSLFFIYLFIFTNKYSTSNKLFNISILRSPKYLSNKSNRNYSTLTNVATEENFLRWFSGFSDAEGNFNIAFYKNKLGSISSATFRFIIELHVDDKDTLNIIKQKLNIGNDIAVYGNSCKFTVTHPKDIYKLIEILDKYNLNTTKYLDYIDFKEAFKLYQSRVKTIKDEEIFNKLLDIKNGMNSNRINFNFPLGHKITITDYWLLGLIEGDGSFYLDRSKMEPAFSIVQSNIQLSLIEEIKNYLINKLGFDKYSIFKLNNTSLITIIKGKAEKNSKPLSVLRIMNTNVLTNYLIPYLDKMTFISKKFLDYKDFKLICKAIYDGAYRTEDIKELIIKLSYSMNNYRLSTNSDVNKLDSLSNQDRDKIIKAKPTIRHLDDGQQLSIITGKPVNRRWTNSVFEIIKENGEILLASTLNDAADILGVDYRTISRHLASKTAHAKGEFVLINNSKIRRVPVFYN